MTSSSNLRQVRHEVDRRVNELRTCGQRLSPLDLHRRMDEIRRLAADHGIIALECLARASAQRALLPGHRVAMVAAIEHVDDAFACRTEQDTTAMLAALAQRLN